MEKEKETTRMSKRKMESETESLNIRVGRFLELRKVKLCVVPLGAE